MLAKDLLQLLNRGYHNNSEGFGCEPWFRWCEGYVISGLDKIYLVFNDHVYSKNLHTRLKMSNLKLLLKKYLDKKIIFISDFEIENIPQPASRLLGARYFEPSLEDMCYNDYNFRFKESSSPDPESIFKFVTKENYIKLLENMKGE